MNSLVIVYRGRVGSSALVEAIARRPAVCVPVFEHLDRHFLDRFLPGRDIVADLDEVLRTGRLDAGPDWMRQQMSDWRGDKSDVRGVGFKWRPHGRLRRVLALFRRHGVTLVLLRRDPVDAAASLYISTRRKAADGHAAVGAGHYQFAFARLSEADKQRAQAELEGIRVPLSLTAFTSHLFRQVGAQARLVLFLQLARLRGLRVAQMDYSAIRASADDAACAVLRFARLPEASAAPDAAPTFQKATRTPALRRIERSWMIWLSPVIAMLVALERILFWSLPRIDGKMPAGKPRATTAGEAS